MASCYNSKYVTMVLSFDRLTLRIPNIRGLDSDTKDINKSIIEMITKEPSIIFHPEVK